MAHTALPTTQRSGFTATAATRSQLLGVVAGMVASASVVMAVKARQRQRKRETARMRVRSVLSAASSRAAVVGSLAVRPLLARPDVTVELLLAGAQALARQAKHQPGAAAHASAHTRT